MELSSENSHLRSVQSSIDTYENNVDTWTGERTPLQLRFTEVDGEIDDFEGYLETANG